MQGSKKPRKQKFTLNMALREAGISREEEVYLHHPRVAKAMAAAAKKEIRDAKNEANKNLKRFMTVALATALGKK